MGVKQTWRFALHMPAFDPQRILSSEALVNHRGPRIEFGPR